MPPAEVRIEPAVLRAILDAAAAHRPFEMAGAVGGSSDASLAIVDDFVPLRLAVPSRTAFAVDAAAFADAEARLRRRGRAWLGFVHSHPDGDAVPSARDRAELWPDCLQLIAGTGADGAARLGAFRFHGDRTDTLRVVVGDAGPVR